MGSADGYAQAARDCEWSRPVNAEEVAAARRGDWAVKLTPGALPAHWLGDVRGREILCLASAGGQQAPILAAAGARVTLFDASAGQLDKDRQVAARDRLELACVQGDMRDLSTFADASFDLVFNPISNLYVDDVLPVWRECARVLRPGGKLLASFYNPALFIEDRSPELAEQGLIRPRHRLPYSDLESLSAEALAAKREKGEALVFGHSLTQTAPALRHRPLHADLPRHLRAQAEVRRRLTAARADLRVRAPFPPVLLSGKTPASGFHRTASHCL